MTPKRARGASLHGVFSVNKVPVVVWKPADLWVMLTMDMAGVVGIGG